MQKDKVQNQIKIFAGGMVFLTTLLGFFAHPYWLFATMFIGLNLFQYGFTGFCPLEKILNRLA